MITKTKTMRASEARRRKRKGRRQKPRLRRQIPLLFPPLPLHHPPPNLLPLSQIQPRQLHHPRSTQQRLSTSSSTRRRKQLPPRQPLLLPNRHERLAELPDPKDEPLVGFPRMNGWEPRESLPRRLIVRSVVALSEGFRGRVEGRVEREEVLSRRGVGEIDDSDLDFSAVIG